MPEQQDAPRTARDKPHHAVWVWAGSGAVSAFLLAVIAHWVDWHDLRAVESSADPLWLFGTLALTLTSIFIKGMRVRSLLADASGPVSPVFAALRMTSLHQVAFTLFPSGTGDAMWPILASRLLGAPYSRSTAALFVMRLQDALILSVLGIAAALLLWHPGARGLMEAVAVGLAGLLSLHSIRFVAFRILGAASKLVTSAGRLHRMVAGLRNALDRSDALHADRVTILLGLAAWLLLLASVATAFRAFSTPLSIGQAAVVLFSLNALGAAALFTVAGVGIAEPGLAGVLTLLHVPAHDTLTLAVIVRSTLLLANLGLPLLTAVGLVLHDLSSSSPKRRR